MKLSAVVAGLGMIGLAGVGVAAVGGLVTGNIEVTGDLDEFVAQLRQSAEVDALEADAGSARGILAQWLVGFPIGSAAMLVLALRFAPYLGHLLTSWSDEAREWARVGRAVIQQRYGIKDEKDEGAE